MTRVVHMAFGPQNTFVLWLNEDAGKTLLPKYRSSKNLPVDLLGRLYGRHHDIEKLRSVALGSDQYYVVTAKLVTGRRDAEWDLLPKYRRLHRILKDAQDRGSAIVSIGPDGDFYESSHGHRHCASRNTGLGDEVDGMAIGDAKFVALGLDGCGLILDKRCEIIRHGPLPAKYPTLVKDLEKHMKPGSERKAASVALNSFREDEYFIAFNDGTFCYQSQALGGHCEPPEKATSSRYQRQRIPGNLSFTSTAEKKARNKEIYLGQQFDKLMKTWGVKLGLQLEPLIDSDTVQPDELADLNWLEPHAVDRSTGETPAWDALDDTNRGIVYGP